jgi:hypothetical protein
MLRRITEHVDPGLPREVLLQPRLEEQAGTGRGLPQLRIGRHPNNDIVLTSAGIPLLLSRRQAVITYDGEQYIVVDQDTTNGTYVRARAATQQHPARCAACCCAATPPRLAGRCALRAARKRAAARHAGVPGWRAAS